MSASSAVRWLQRWRDTGSARAKLSGGSTLPLEEHVEWLLALVLVLCKCGHGARDEWCDSDAAMSCLADFGLSRRGAAKIVVLRKGFAV
jgi:hypothetical protein